MSTLSELRTRARQKVDAVNSLFFSDSEVSGYVNTGLGELYDILVLKYEDYFVSSLTFNLASGTSNYTFSSIGFNNFYKRLGMDATQSGDTVKVRRSQFSDRNRYLSSEVVHNVRGHALYEYGIRGNSFEFTPDPTSTDEIKVWYIPKFQKLENDSDQVNDNIMSNWEEYAILVAAIKMRQKEETATSSLENELQRVTQLIENAASNRDANEPFGIVDENVGITPSHFSGSGWR